MRIEGRFYSACLKPLVLLFVVALFVCASEEVYAQQTDRIEISPARLTIEQAFKQIEEQTGLKFAYKDSAFSVEQGVNLKRTKGDLDQMLAAILEGFDYSYVVKPRHIVITVKAKRTPPPPKIEHRNMSGVVRDVKTGRGVSFARVALKSGVVSPVVADTLGRFRIERVPVAAQELTFSAIGYEGASVSIPAGVESIVSVAAELSPREWIDEPEQPIIYVDTTARPSFSLVPYAVVADKSKVVRRHIPYTNNSEMEYFDPKGEVSLSRIGVRSNVLSVWAVAIINAGLDVALSERLTLGAHVSCNPFRIKKNQQEYPVSFQYWVVQSELKYWLCRRYEAGYWGLHLMGGAYEVENPPTAKGHSERGKLMGAGVSYGYQWALGKRWGVEASAGAGVVYMKYKHYDCPTCGLREGDSDRFYYGPTKLALSFIYFLK